jgi:hypothetical protein
MPPFVREEAYRCALGVFNIDGYRYVPSRFREPPPFDPVRGGLAFVIGLLTGLYTLVSELYLHTQPAPVLWLFVVLGAILATVSAFRQRGLLVSWLLVLGPVCGPLAFYDWLTITRQQAPVALVLSFHGYGAVSFWIPTAFMLGTLAYGIGALTRISATYLAGQ